MNRKKNTFLKIFLLLMLVVAWGGGAWAQRVAPMIENAYNQDGHWYYLRFSHHGRYAQANGVGNVITIPNSKATNGSCWWQFVGDNDDFVIVDFSGNYITWANPYKLTLDKNQAAHFMLDPHTGDANVWELKNKGLTGQAWMNPRTGNNNIQHWNDNDNGNKLIFDAVTEQEIWELNYTGPKWYTMKPNNGGYISSDYATADGRMHVSNSNGKPTTYAGIWRFYDVPGVEGQNLINAKYYESRVLSVEGTDGTAVSKMDPVSSIRSGSRYKFEIASNGFVKVQGESLYLGNNSMQLCVRTSTGDGSLNLNLTRVPNLGNAVTIKCIDSNGDEVADATIAYLCRREDISTKTNLLSHDDVYDFKDVPYMEYIFTDSPTCEIISISYDEIHATITFVVRRVESTEWTFNITEGYTVSYNDFIDIDNGTKVVLPVNINRMFFSVKNTGDKFVWGPIIDTHAKTITYNVRDLATTLTSGWYQLQIADNEVATLSDQIIPKAGNINTKDNTLYLAPALYASDANQIMKVTGVPQYAGEASTFVYIENMGGGNYSLTSSVTGQSISGPCTFNNGVLTKFRYCSYEDTAQPLEGPFLLPTGNSTPSFRVAKADISKYTIYKVGIKEDGAAVSDIRLNISNSHVLGSTVVSDGGYLFMLKNSTMPSISQVSVTMGNVVVTNITTDVEVDGVKPITFHVATKQTMWKAVIIGDAANIETDSIIYSGNKYKSGDSIHLPESYEPTTLDFKTNVTDRFVWGPIINWDENTVTFEVRTPATNLEAGKWYQMQLSPTAVGRYYVPNETGNLVAGILKMNPRNAGSQIYMIGANKTSGSWTTEFIGKPANEAETYLYINYRNGNATQVMMQNSYYITDQSQYSSSASNTQFEYNSTTNEFHWRNPVYPWGNLNGMNAAVGKSSTADGPIKIIAHEVPVKAYKITGISGYKVEYIGEAKVIGSKRVANNYFLFLESNQIIEGEGSTIDVSKFILKGTSETITSISAATTGGYTTLTFAITTPTFSNTIVHREHDVYDRIATVDDNSLPKGSHIKRGEGMIEHPMAAGFTTDNTDNDRQIQNTSTFHVTQYTKPGARTECILPFTKGKSTGDHLRQYQRWYNYQTERPLADEIIRLDNGSSTLGNFNVFVNGHSNYNFSGNRQYEVLGKADIKLPVDSTDIYVGVDASEFQDSKSLGNGNLLEPSLNMRVVYHIISAHEMAKKLTTTGDMWWEAKEFYVPNIKRGSDTYKNNADLIPLDMPFSNYWFYKTLGSVDVQQSDAQLMPIVAEGGNYNTLRSNLEIVVEGTAKDYLEIGVFDGSPGSIGSAPYINSNHFLYYKVKGAGVTRTVPAGSQAVIKVYAKDGSNASSPKYQLFKFTLNFQAATEPLTITSVVGNPASTRSVDYFIQNGFKESASLTFKNKEVSFTKIPGWRNDGNEGVTYAFPIDFSRTSYGYSPSNSFGNYRITTKGYGNQFRPVSLYEHNIKNRTNTTLKSTDDYFFFIDAAESPGQVASITLDGTLCVGSRLYCYGWFGSSNNYNGDGNPSGASVLLQVVGHRHDGTEEVIASYLPGTITDVSYDDEGDMMRSLSYASFPSQQASGWMDINATRVGVWNSVGFSFIVKDVDFDSYDLRIINNCFSTSGGDYVLDDFRVFVSPPKGNVDFTTPLCSDALRHVKVHTDFDMLLEAAGVNTEIGGDSIPVSFCFLNKKIYDEATKDYYDVDESGNRTLKSGIDYNSEAVKSIFNQAFGDALIGVRSIDKSVKGHAFHNFTVPVDFNNIPTYAYNESPDDQIFKEEKDNGERRIVFKEQLYQSDGSTHNWVPGESYYLLFAPFHVEAGHVTSHDVGTSTFDIASLCCVLTIFDIMPPIEVKGDATVTSSDQVKACDNQVVTFKVDMPALKLDDDGTGVSDAVISGLNYDWWIGNSKEEATYQGFYEAEFGEYATIENARRYNHKSVDDYPDDTDVDKKVYLQSALENIRFYFPEARTLDEVSLVEFDNDNGYGIVQEHIECVRHFITPLENGRKPLSLFGQTFNLKVSHAEADDDHKQHFVAIPIIPKQDYGVDEKLIYCPAPQELIIHVADQAPNLQNGFGDMTYPDYIVNVPIRIGRQQIEGVRKEAEADLAGNTLSIPLRKIQVVDGSSTKLMVKSHDTEPFGPIYLAATDDSQYPFDAEGGEFAMRRVAQVIELNAEKSSAEDGYMKIAFTSDFPVREGCTYTLKLPYVEDVACQCEGTLVFDIKVVPEYQVWTGAAGNSDWTNDGNWARADRTELNAGAKAAGSGMMGATALDDANSYASNETNTTANSFVPMYFTNVLFKDNSEAADANLYEESDFVAPDRSQNKFLGGLKETATKDIVYDLSVKPVNEDDRTNFRYNVDYDCEFFDTYIANGITFLPGSRLVNAHFLNYKKAWVEYELKTERWYMLSSPLQNTFAGEWYAPTDGGRQMTPHFYGINYSQDDNHRFQPAIYQRSWDSKGNNPVYLKQGGKYDAYVRADWSYVYNDVTKEYSEGGFSVKASERLMEHKPSNGKVLVRMPKADIKYTYYDKDNQTGAKPDDVLAITENRNRLWSDKVKNGATFSQTIKNETKDNNFFLVGNPFMADMDMDEFFEVNDSLEKKFWIMTEEGQKVNVKVDGDLWIGTDGIVGKVAPLQGFFVKGKGNTATVTFSAEMQTASEDADNAPIYAARAARRNISNMIRLTAERNGAKSVAVIMLSENAKNEYVAGEDCETFIDANLYDRPTVYTSADAMAQTINVRKSMNMVPVGMISSDDGEALLTFDLSSYTSETLYLYDSEGDNYTEIEDGTFVTMSGNNAGRYYLTTSVNNLDEQIDYEVEQRLGVWTVSGIYCGETINGLPSGVYVVDGVKMLIK